MYTVFLIGRIALVATFLVSGVQNLWDIAAAAKIIEAKVTIPATLATLAANATTATGMSAFKLLAIATAVIEIVFALFVIFNLGTRFAALVLLVYVAVATFFMYDFWNMTGDALTLAITEIMKNLSIMGAMLMLFVIGPWQPVAADAEDSY